MQREVVRLLASMQRNGEITMSDLKELPKLDSPSLDAMEPLFEEIRADAFQAARGNKSARTRVRVKLSQLAKLCKEARKEILPAK